MKKYHRYITLLCLSAAAATPLLGSRIDTPAVRVAEDYQSRPRPTPRQNPAKAPQETTAVKVVDDYAPPRPRPNQPVGRDRAQAQAPRQPVVENRPAGRPQRALSSKPQQTVVSRPAVIPRVEPGRPATVVSAPPRPQPPARVVLSTPRKLPTTPLPTTVQLDRRCAPYDFVMLRPYTISPRGNVLELVDGSVWHISKKRDRRKVRNWTLWDNIIIESSQLLGWTSFSLVNYTRGESVAASMTVGPVYEGLASHWVTQFDPARRFLVLEDGSSWSFMEASFGDWRENDAVVLGLSKDTSGQYVYMLINTRTQKHSLAINIR